MKTREIQAIQEAVRNGDGDLLRRTVESMAYPDMDEIRNVVDDVPGARWSNIDVVGDVVVGNVKVADRFGLAEVWER